MAWDSKYLNYGIVKIDGDKLKVYWDQANFTIIYVGRPITSVNWAGGELNVYLSDGTVRRYRDQNNHTTI
jgi:hypothetical protein